MKWKSRLGYVVGAGKDCCLSTTFAAKQNNSFFFSFRYQFETFFRGLFSNRGAPFGGECPIWKGNVAREITFVMQFLLEKKNSVQIGQINSEHGLSFLDFNLARWLDIATHFIIIISSSLFMPTAGRRLFWKASNSLATSLNTFVTTEKFLGSPRNMLFLPQKITGAKVWGMKW